MSTVRTTLSPELSARKFHLPFGAPSVPQARLSVSESTAAKMDDLYEPGTPTSSAFPKFASPSQASGVDEPGPAFPDQDDHPEMQDEFSDGDAVSSLRWARDKDLASVSTDLGKEHDEQRLSSPRLDRRSMC